MVHSSPAAVALFALARAPGGLAIQAASNNVRAREERGPFSNFLGAWSTAGDGQPPPISEIMLAKPKTVSRAASGGGSDNDAVDDGNDENPLLDALRKEMAERTSNSSTTDTKGPSKHRAVAQTAKSDSADSRKTQIDTAMNGTLLTKVAAKPVRHSKHGDGATHTIAAESKENDNMTIAVQEKKRDSVWKSDTATQSDDAAAASVVTSKAGTEDGAAEDFEAHDGSEEDSEGNLTFARRWARQHKVQSVGEERRAASDAAVGDSSSVSKTIADVAERHSHKHGRASADAAACDVASEDCKTMCTWLKLSDRERDASCPLFDWQLKACEYVPPEVRTEEDDSSASLDCTVTMTRTFVPESQVAGYVGQLDECIAHVPSEVNATCYMALDLLRSELRDWRQESEDKQTAEKLRVEIAAACKQGTEALEASTEEQAAIDRLSKGLSDAETIEGHYLVSEVHEARRLLDKLGPIPAAREQLKGALEDGNHAFETTSLFRVKEAIIWLNVAVEKAELYHVGEPIPEAKEMLKKLGGLNEALTVLHEAVFEGNVSFMTKSSVPQAVEELKASIRSVKSAGLTDEMPVIQDLLHELEHLEGAVQSNENATQRGDAILEGPGGKGRERLEAAINWLNGTVENAQSLGLADNETTDAAVGTLDKLSYVRHARSALHDAAEKGEELLKRTGSVLSDDEDEATIDTLTPAIAWGKEVGLTGGMPSAAEVLWRLKAMEKAKEGMVQALAQGNASLAAKAGAETSIRLLEAAVNQSDGSNVTAGVERAKDYIAKLLAMQAAWDALGSARDAANRSYDSRSGFDDSAGSLTTAVGLAKDAGIAGGAEIAGRQLEKLTAFKHADKELVDALAKPLPDVPDLGPVALDDPEPKDLFERDGLKPVDLAPVALGEDDGDADFEEHIGALQDGIAHAQEEGEVDSEMKGQLEVIKGKSRAYSQLSDATKAGEAALRSKTRIQMAMTALTAAVREANEIGLQQGVERASELLSKLVVIQPARDELKAARLQANVSMATTSDMDVAMIRLNRAMDVNKALKLVDHLDAARRTRDNLLELKEAFVNLKAALVQGQIALKMEEGEEEAISELQSAIDRADKVNLHQPVHDAMDVLHELMHMNAEKQQLQAAMDPVR